MAAAGLRLSQTAADRLGFSPNHNQHPRLQGLQSTVPQAVVGLSAAGVRMGRLVGELV